MESSSPQPPRLPRRSAGTSSESTRPGASSSSAFPRASEAADSKRRSEKGSENGFEKLSAKGSEKLSRKVVLERADSQHAGGPAPANDILRQVAKFSWYAPLIGFSLAVVFKRVIGPDSPFTMILAFVQVLLIAAGLICGIVAFIWAGHRSAESRKGIFGNAVAGICVNVALIVVIFVLLDALGNARAVHTDMVQNSVKEREVQAAMEASRRRHAAQPASPDVASPSTEESPESEPGPATAIVPVSPAPRPSVAGPSARAIADPAWRHPQTAQKNAEGEFVVLIFGDNSKLVDDATLKLLATIPTLRRLHLDRTSITDAGLIHLADLPALQAVSLVSTAVTDAGMPALSRSAVQSVNLSLTAVTDAGLRELTRSPRIISLSLNGTKVSAAGVRAVQREGLYIFGMEEPAVAANPAPAQPAPVTPAPVTPAPVKPAPVTPAPVTPPPAPTTTAPTPRPPRTATPPAPPVAPKAPVEDPARPPRDQPAAPKAPRTPRSELDRAESKMRLDINGIRIHALRNDRKYPAALGDIDSPFYRDEHKTDHWGDAYLYFGVGKAYDPFDKSKALLLATAKAHDGKRIVAYTTGKIEVIDESAFAALVAAGKK